jgi:hypothetical protein
MEKNIKNGVAAWVEFLGTIVDPMKKYEWSGSDATLALELLRRSAVVRQYEAMQATLKMVDAGIGHFAVTLLRPAYEEMVWLEYLSANHSIANELTRLMAANEAADSIDAQNHYLGAKAMAQIGFTQRFVKVRLAQQREVKARIRGIGKALGWREGASLPSMQFVATKVGRKIEHEFVYQGTSRSVHFSTGELLRRAWGKRGSVTITSDNFSDYWQDFALYWSLRLFVNTLIACHEVLPSFDIPDDRMKELMDWLTPFPAIPIITSGELESWNERPKPA